MKRTVIYASMAIAAGVLITNIYTSLVAANVTGKN